VRVRLVAEIEPPSSWSSVRRERAIAGEIAPTVKPDFDNLQKNVFDALNGVVYRDDAQIVSSTVEKVYARKSRVHVRVEPMDAEPAYRR
jgi:Holliday junction resolvase RusA-like endonuclease